MSCGRLAMPWPTTPEQADLVVLNTCHIREHASEKVYSELGRLRDLKVERRAEGRDLTIAVAGCVAQAEGEEIARRQPAVDIVVGPQAYHRLPELLAEAERKSAFRTRRQAPAGRRRARHRFPGREQVRPPAGAAGRARRLGLPVDPGRLRQVLHLLRRALYARRRIFAAGRRRCWPRRASWRRRARSRSRCSARTSTPITARRPDGSTWSLARLIRALAEIEGIARIRYTTSHPRDMDDELIAAHGEVPQLMPYLHLPVQSGSDRILEAMNRRHGRDLFLRPGRSPARARGPTSRCRPTSSSASRARAMPISTTRCGWSSRWASPRPSPSSTAAGPARRARRWRIRCRRAVKAARLAALQALLGQQARAFNASKVGPTVPVLFAEPGRKPGQLIGKTPWLQSVYAEGNAAPDRPHRRRAADRRPCQQPGRRDRHRRLRGRRVSVRSGAGRSADVRRMAFDDNALLVELYGVHDRQPRAHRAARQCPAARPRQPARRSPAKPTMPPSRTRPSPASTSG